MTETRRREKENVVETRRSEKEREIERQKNLENLRSQQHGEVLSRSASNKEGILRTSRPCL